jgi:putative colanic acid biosynthesis acetyltransferase WcaF
VAGGALAVIIIAQHMADLDIHKSEWGLRSKVVRALWMLTRGLLFRASFHNWYGWRRFVLRCFGATVGKGVRVRPTVRIEMPWNLCLQDDCIIGDYAILYSLGRITIGSRAVISQ